MVSIEKIEVDYESIIRNITDKISYFEVLFTFNNNQYRLLFKKSINESLWSPTDIVEECSDGFCIVTDSFTDEIYESISDFIYNQIDVQVAFRYFNDKEKESFLVRQSNAEVEKIGERYWSKIVKKITCAFLMDKGFYYFVLPIQTEGLSNSLKISLEEIMFSYDSEDDFINHAVQELKNLENLHLEKLKRSNKQFF